MKAERTVERISIAWNANLSNAQNHGDFFAFSMLVSRPIIINLRLVVMFLSYSFDFYCFMHKVVNNVFMFAHMMRVLFHSFCMTECIIERWHVPMFCGMTRKVVALLRLHHKSFNLIELSLFETRRYNITSRERCFMCASQHASSEGGERERESQWPNENTMRWRCSVWQADRICCLLSIPQRDPRDVRPRKSEDINSMMSDIEHFFSPRNFLS